MGRLKRHCFRGAASLKTLASAGKFLSLSSLHAYFISITWLKKCDQLRAHGQIRFCTFLLSSFTHPKIACSLPWTPHQQNSKKCLQKNQNHHLFFFFCTAPSKYLSLILFTFERHCYGEWSKVEKLNINLLSN